MSSACFAGIDVSKSSLVVALASSLHQVQSKAFEFVNDFDGFKRLASLLEQHKVQRVVFEASGGYEKPLRSFCLNHNIECCRLQPARARYFAIGLGLIEKTDALDAQLLARMASLEIHRIEQDFGQQHQQLVELMDFRIQLVTQSTRLKNQLDKTTSQMVKSLQQAQLQQVQDQIVQVEQLLEQLVKADESWSAQYQNLNQISGVGKVLIWTLLAYLPELGQLNRKEIAKLAGLAPIAKESGTIKQVRRTAAGRRKIKTALWMASLSVVRFDEQFKLSYESLLKRGKPKKVARMAVCRKLLTVCNAIVRDDCLYNSELIKPRQVVDLT